MATVSALIPGTDRQLLGEHLGGGQGVGGQVPQDVVVMMTTMMMMMIVVMVVMCRG